ncbi:MFS transporter [Naumannella halotolerans]|uniref:MFS transporter n=1 Tax=Naumannella halotolerans TaxID=993414 RepID=UPI00370DB988
MDFFRALRRLWRHRLFRRLLALRVATQASDAAMQVGLAAYVLFSPNEQPDAGSIVAVLAITLLPFSLVGPFISPSLDRWNRRQVFVVTDMVRVVLATGVAVLVVFGERSGLAMAAIYVLALLALSINRFMMAGMSAALARTVDPDEYLLASSTMPIVGPIGGAIGAGTAAAIRLIGGASMPTWQADALIFVAAAIGFAIGIQLALRIPRTALGPDPEEAELVPMRRQAGLVLGDLADAVRHLRERSTAGLGLLIVLAQRITYGMVTVSAILLYRNWFNTVDQVDTALAQLGIWLAATGAGYIAAAPIAPIIGRRFGVRNMLLAGIVLCAVVQLVPGSIFTQATLVIAAFFLGLGSQALKVGVDTLIQAQVDDEFKGRSFVLYDMIFNVALVTGGALVWWLFPSDGHTLAGFVALAVVFALIAAVFAVASRRIGVSVFDRGTERAIVGN